MSTHCASRPKYSPENSSGADAAWLGQLRAAKDQLLRVIESNAPRMHPLELRLALRHVEQSERRAREAADVPEVEV